jgi:hypothetical protein
VTAATHKSKPIANDGAHHGVVIVARKPWA